MREKVEQEKNELETRLQRLIAEVEEKNRKEEEQYRPITSLYGTSVTFPQSDGITREGNTIIHHEPDRLCRNCFLGKVMTSVSLISYSSLIISLPNLSFFLSLSISISLIKGVHRMYVSISFLILSHSISLSTFILHHKNNTSLSLFVAFVSHISPTYS